MKKTNYLLLIFMIISSFIVVSSCGDDDDSGSSSDACENVTCQNGGTCVDGVCQCTVGYSGTRCETHCTENLVGRWQVVREEPNVCLIDFYMITQGATSTTIDLAIHGTSDSTFATDITFLSDDCDTATFDVPSVSYTGSFSVSGDSMTTQINGPMQSCQITAVKQ